MNNPQFDIVIPVGPKDIEIAKKQIEFTIKNIIDYRNIYVVSHNSNIQLNNCIIINQDIFPFSIDTVAEFHGKIPRNGWYLQQLIKFYAGFVIPNISSKYLVIDSDTFFLKPIKFIDNNLPLYTYLTEYHKPYFAHMQKLHDSLIRVDQKKSGICHHMMFDIQYIQEIIDIIENKHNNSFINVFLGSVAPDQISGAGASEYEIYFNFMLKNYPEKIQLRALSYKKIKEHSLYDNNMTYDYVSCHWYGR